MPNDFTVPVPAPTRPATPSTAEGPGYCPRRLRDAARLAVQRTDNPREFFVASRSRKVPRAVNLDGVANGLGCDCEDHFWNRVNCAHILAGRLASGDLPLIQALGDMLLRAEKNLKEHTTRRRRRPTLHAQPER